MLALEGVDAGYGDEPVLLDVELVVARGERVGVVGPNGGGKTTLLRVLTEELGAVRRHALGGRRHHRRLPLAGRGLAARRRHVLDALRAGRSLAEDAAVRLLMALPVRLRAVPAARSAR